MYKKIIISLAGPFVNLVFMLLAYVFPLEDNIKKIIIYSNLVLMLTNLLPIYPLDGGRILKTVLHIEIGYLKACSITNQISNIMTILIIILSSVLIFYFENVAILFLIVYLIILIIRENRRFQIIKRTYTILENDRLVLEKVKV